MERDDFPSVHYPQQTEGITSNISLYVTVSLVVHLHLDLEDLLVSVFVDGLHLDFLKFHLV